jgi:putative serine protease PepD
MLLLQIKFERPQLSDFNRQFIFDPVPAEVSAAKKLPFRKRLARKTNIFTGTALVAVGAIVGALVGTGATVLTFGYLSQPAPVVVNNAQSVNWVTGAAAAASPSTVTLSVAGGNGAGNGSGVFLTKDGFILTNSHVVTLGGAAAAAKIQVKTFDGHVYDAEIIGTDPTNDLAVIKVTANIAFTPIRFADSDRLNVGDSVVAIGAPLGLQNTVTNGIISALDRTIQVASSEVPDESEWFGGLQLFSGSGDAINLRVIQTDAAINPGNSGGALVNENGELVGINVAIASAGSGSQSGNIGVGFAIPSNTAKRIAAEIIKTGTASHGLLGAAVSDAASSEGAAAFTVGAKIEELTSGGAAEKYGLKVGDVIKAVNGKEVTSASELTAAIRNEPAGAKVTISLLRNGTERSVTVVLGDAEDLNRN